jgi:hypothetical protein
VVSLASIRYMVKRVPHREHKEEIHWIHNSSDEKQITYNYKNDKNVVDFYKIA